VTCIEQSVSGTSGPGTSDAVVVGMTLPAISHFMTVNPCTIDRLASLTDAHRLMKERGVRHLPVLDDGDLCGIVTERDLLMVESLIGADPTTTQVDAAMTDRPFIVTSDTLLDEVVDIMTDRKYGSVIVVGHNGVEGIFTTVDACRALSQVLRERPA
jgi:acetoin utilization protein AcuB